MKAAVLQDYKKITFENRKIPIPKAGEVLVKIIATGICGSDVHFFNNKRIGNTVIKGPIILGHECSGIIEDSNKAAYQIGDRVVIEPGFYCNNCEYCRKGKYNLCTQMEFLGTYPKDGTFVEYITVPEYCVFGIPDNISYEEGALIEPTAVAIQSIKRGRVKMGEVVAVIGAGPIGLLILQAAIASGISQAFMIDINEFRLEKAKKLGADVIIDARKKDVVKEIMKLTCNRGVDVALEAVGSEITTNKAVAIAARGGRVVLTGTGVEPIIGINVSEIISKELDIFSTWRYLFNYPTAISLVSKNLINVKELITHNFKFDDIEQAMLLANEKEKYIKIVLTLQEK